MTLVIATGGIDLSVGAVVRDLRRRRLPWIASSPDPTSAGAALAGIGARPRRSPSCSGLWNGFLVAVLGIQPIIATLVLMVAGRGLAQLITDGQIITVNNAPSPADRRRLLLAVPLTVIVAAAVFALVALVTRRTALGMLIESVGDNPEASRLAGIRSRGIIWTVYVFAALCAGIAGLMISSNVTGADANNAGPVDRARRDPRRRHRRHVARRRPVLDRRHAARRADHPDADHHDLLDRHPAGGRRCCSRRSS